MLPTFFFPFLRIFELRQKAIVMFAGSISSAGNGPNTLIYVAASTRLIFSFSLCLSTFLIRAIYKCIFFKDHITPPHLFLEEKTRTEWDRRSSNTITGNLRYLRCKSIEKEENLTRAREAAETRYRIEKPEVGASRLAHKKNEQLKKRATKMATRIAAEKTHDRERIMRGVEAGPGGERRTRG